MSSFLWCVCWVLLYTINWFFQDWILIGLLSFHQERRSEDVKIRKMLEKCCVLTCSVIVLLLDGLLECHHGWREVCLSLVAVRDRDGVQI